MSAGTQTAPMQGAGREEANAQQRIASDPAVSAFVSASAGSGKTKLLTDRLLRLMLGDGERPGSDPARIQCLTFTKAAAAEMSLRLQRVLGAWVTLDDDALDRHLRDLQIAPDAAMRQRARALFVQVLDLPGGMRIGTIHAFCQSLLRRFPLEAQLSPHFRLLDDADKALRLSEAREGLLERAQGDARRDAVQAVSGLMGLQDFGGVVEALRTDLPRLTAVFELGAAALHEALCGLLQTGTDLADIMQDAVEWPQEGRVRAALKGIVDKATPARRARAQQMLDWLAQPPPARLDSWEAWRSEFFTKAGETVKLSGFVTEAVSNRHPELLEAMAEEQARVVQVADRLAAHRLAVLCRHLVTLAAPIADSYRLRNQMTSAVDYHDLIRRSSALLVDPGAAWVLYKLDGGIDHLLLDEVQDTAPEQWDIAGAMAAEFFAGSSARTVPASIFAVGDPKQSIFSFQGADPAAFHRWRGLLRTRVEDAGQHWRDVGLRVSFRSTTPVLRLVDAVFAQPAAAAGVAAPGTLSHVADRAADAGRVELWPLTPATPKPEASAWEVPERNLRQVSAAQLLADTLADWVVAQIAAGVHAPSRGRALQAGDVLILVRRRNAFQRQLTRALKIRGVPVAGLDRMVLTEQPAVVDLLSLCDTLLLPQDDLSLACVLTSPLGGLSDDSLMRLSAGRQGALWTALRARHREQPDWDAAHGFLAALLARTDHVSPFLLLSEALGAHGGRHRLLRRLGADSAEAVDELLNIAQAYGRTHLPSLQGFLHWVRQAASEVKREAEGAGGAVRIMTVHGAKGLQAPLVILPDTTSLPPGGSEVHWHPCPRTGLPLPVWSGHRSHRCQVAGQLSEAAGERQREEQNRLLYVALTRAEDRLLVCGIETARKGEQLCWYDHVRAGFDHLGAAGAPFDAGAAPWPGEIRHLDHGDATPPAALSPSVPAPGPDLPAWAGAAPAWQAGPVPAEPPRPRPLAPSRPDGVEWGEAPGGASPLPRDGAAQPGAGPRFRLGEVTHRLLQHLPDIDPEAREGAILRYLGRAAADLSAAARGRVAQELAALLGHPAMQALLSPAGRSEVAVAGTLGDLAISGSIDRMVVEPGQVLIADYKTDRVRPAAAEAVPRAYLRQLAAYRALLRRIHPDRPVRCLLVWTVDTTVMELDAELLDRHAPGVAP